MIISLSQHLCKFTHPPPPEVFLKYFFVILAYLGALALVLLPELGSEHIHWAWPSTDILWQFRLPKVAIASLGGMALAISALILQSYFKNPMAGPFTLGVSSGASFFVALFGFVQVYGFSYFGLNIQADAFLQGGRIVFALVGAGLMTGLLALLNQMRGIKSLHILLFGILLSALFESLTSLILWWSNADQVRVFVMWGMGSFDGFELKDLWVFLPLFMLGTTLALIHLKNLDLLCLGEESAQALGLKLSNLRRGVLVATALLAGSVTAFCGPIAFLGMASPHLAQWIFGTELHRFRIVSTALVGATLGLISAGITSLFMGQVPLQTVMALWGAPIMILVLWKLAKQNSARHLDEGED